MDLASRVSSELLLASSDVSGAVMLALHFGHGPVIPAIFAGTRSLLPQLGQWKTMMLELMLGVGIKSELPG